MQPLPIDLDELAEAMDQFDRDISDYYLDTQTGKVILIETDLMEDEDDLDEDDLDEDDQPDDDSMPDWQRQAAEQARAIQNDATDRYVWIPEADQHEGYSRMEEFVATVTDERANDLLSRAINGKGAFRRFKDTLFELPAIRERWFKFESQRKWEAAAEWLESIGLESTWQPPTRPK